MNIQRASTRWGETAGLYLALGFLVPLAKLSHWMTGHSLTAAERARDRLAKLRAQRFAAEREIAYRAYMAASRRGDTRDMNRASASLQSVTHEQLRAELGR